MNPPRRRARVQAEQIGQEALAPEGRTDGALALTAAADGRLSTNVPERKA